MTDIKPQNEVVEETRETLHVVEQPRLTRPQKLAAERAYFDGAHEVRFSERAFRPRHAASLDEIRAFVDALVVERRDAAPLPPPPEPAPVAVEPRIPEHYRVALEPLVQGALLRVETVHRVGTGTVVDVEWEARDEGARRGLFVIEDGQARPYEDVASRIDELPPPVLAPPAQPAPEATPPAPPAPPPPAKRRFGFGRKGAPGPEAAPAPPPAPEEEKPKRRFGLRRSK